MHQIPGEFDVLRCADCGLLRVAQMPSNVRQYYPETYGSYRLDRGIVKGRRHWGLQRKANLVRQLYPSGGALLDVGCAAGHFLAQFQGDRNWQLHGLEFNHRAAMSARQTFGLPITNASLPDSGLKSGTFDVVTMWHVIEHLPDPVAALREVRRLLRPDGTLVLACPVADSWQAKLFGSFWAGYDVPRHLVTFSRRTLTQALALTGFTPHEEPSVVMGLEMLLKSLAFRLPESSTRLVGLVAAGVFGPLWFLERITGKTAVATFVAESEPDA